MFSLDSVQNKKEKKKKSTETELGLFVVLHFLLLGQESGCKTHKARWREEIAPGKLSFLSLKNAAGLTSWSDPHPQCVFYLV